MSIDYKKYIQTTNFNGVTFYDMDPLLNNYKVRKGAIGELVEKVRQFRPTVVLGIESRGYGLAAHIADELGCGWLMARKAGKTPGEIERVSYSVEYGKTRELELKKNLFSEGERVLIVDDVLATGGTAEAMVKLVERCGGKPVGICFLIEINGLGGRGRCGVPVATLMKLELGEVTPFGEIEEEEKEERVVLKKSNRVVLMYYVSMKKQAKQLLKLYPTMFDEAFIDWSYFPDGTPNIHFEHNLVNRDVVFMGSLYDKNKIMEQMMLTMVLPRQGVKSLTILWPFNSMGTMERVDKEGTLATADTLASMMSRIMPSTKTGLPTVCFYDIHAQQNRFYFDDNVRVNLLTAIDAFKKYVGKELEEMVVVFPDDGSAKRFGQYFEGLPQIVCAKVRNGPIRSVTIKDRINMEGEYKRAVIIDDLVQTGGTLYECLKELKKDGFEEVSAYVTHAVFPNRCYYDFMEGGSKEGFKRFYVTDSVPEVAEQLKKYSTLFTVIPLMPSFAALLMTIIDREEEFQRETMCKVYVGSKNKGKVGAVRRAYEFLGLGCEIVAGEGMSGVPEQPFNEDTEKGSMNRAIFGAGYRKVCVGIENGIYQEDGKNKETVVVTVIDDGEVMKGRRDILESPEEFSGLVEGVKGTGGTFGESFHRLFPELSEDNWHKKFGKDRYEEIKEAVIGVLMN